MARTIKLVDEIADPDAIDALIEYMNRPATEEEKAMIEEAREIYKNTEVIIKDRRK